MAAVTRRSAPAERAECQVRRVRPTRRDPTEPDPVARTVAVPATPGRALAGAIARAAIDFLTGPHRRNLRACTAPRCVRYFVRGHGRQEFCKASCGNRARAARHYQRHQADREA